MSETCPECGAQDDYNLGSIRHAVRCPVVLIQQNNEILERERDLRRQLATMTASCREAQEQAAKLLTDVDMLTAERDTWKRLREVVEKLLRLDHDADAYEGNDPLTQDAVELRDAWREARAAIWAKEAKK